MRQQQLTEHKNLNEMVRRNSKKYYFSSREPSVEREPQPPPRPLQTRNAVSPRNLELLESRFSRWTPVHAEAMKRYSAPSASASQVGDKENWGGGAESTSSVSRAAKFRTDSHSRATGEGNISATPMERIELKYDLELECAGLPALTLQERKRKAEMLNGYLLVSTPGVSNNWPCREMYCIK